MLGDHRTYCGAKAYTSMLQQLSKSLELRAWLEDEILKLETSPRRKKCKNLTAAKHRFESHATPLGRFLMYLDLQKRPK